MQDFSELESLLESYRPRDPAPKLRAQVIAIAKERRERSRLRRRSFVYSLAVVLLLLSFGLSFAAEAVYVENARILRVGQYEWTEEAAETVRLVDGNNLVRRYLALQLAAGILVNPSRVDFYEDI